MPATRSAPPCSPRSGTRRHYGPRIFNSAGNNSHGFAFIGRYLPVFPGSRGDLA
jgi:hypothetical protein